jgi:hypothetical protein
MKRERERGGGGGLKRGEEVESEALRQQFMTAATIGGVKDACCCPFNYAYRLNSFRKFGIG